MNKTVFIMGAGSSVCVGAPVVNNFLKEAQLLYEQNLIEESKEDFQLIFDLLGYLCQIVYSKSKLNLDDIEVILAALEVGNVIDALPERINYENIFKTFKRVILKTLEKKIFYQFNHDGNLIIPKPYEDFISTIKTLKQYINQDSSIITFNYDISLDVSLKKAGIEPIYGFKESHKADNINSINLLKLHGSTNWFRCNNCNEINSLDMGIVLNENMGKKGGKYNIELKPYLDKFYCFNCKEKIMDFDPMIIPPIFNKLDQQLQIKHIWRRAAKELSEADSIVIIGYSLRQSDYFFKYLYSLGTISTTRIKRFLIFNPDLKVFSEFENLIGSDISGDKCFFSQSGFELCKDHIINIFEVFPKK